MKLKKVYLSSMKALVLFALLIGLSTCSDLSKSDHKNDGIDGCEMEIPAHVLAQNQADRLQNLLDSPIDLVTYKTKFGTSNSGTGKNKSLYNLPKEIGFTYEYMYFHKLLNEIDPKPTDSELFKGFRITTYILGTEIPQFTDTNEELLEIACRLNNPTLGALNVFGLSKKEVIFEYGEPHFTHNEQFIYQDSSNQTFTIHFQNDRADWYRYIKLNSSFDLTNEIPSILLNFD